MKTPAPVIATMLLAPLLSFFGCSSPQQAEPSAATVEIAPGDMDRAIDAARAVLLDNRFTIDRVDARRGVLTTIPKQTAGLASPWDPEQSSLDQEIGDLVHHHERVVRVSFEQGASGGPILADVHASIIRVRRPGWRLETESVRKSTHTASISNNNTRMPPVLREPIGEDHALSARLAQEIRDRLAQQPVASSSN
ncbi:MAG: hypothetical protein KC996_03410 [Phycisphaerales bacterium]|nr:hypothetical protein [Phycisphaerales bacterium]